METFRRQNMHLLLIYFSLWLFIFFPVLNNACCLKWDVAKKLSNCTTEAAASHLQLIQFTVLSSLTHGLKSFFESETLVLTSYFHLLSNCRFFKVYHNILRLLMGRFSFACHKICVEIYSDWHGLFRISADTSLNVVYPSIAYENVSDFEAKTE